MAAVPQQEPAKPAKRAQALWIVFELDDRETATQMAPVGTYQARNAEAACWIAAESDRREDAVGPDGIRLVAVKSAEFAPETYRLRSTVERVKA